MAARSAAPRDSTEALQGSGRSGIAFLYPGQGSQYVGMGRSVWEAFPEAREALETADEALGEPLSRLCFEGDEERLRLTENTQPAILAVSVAVHRALEARGVTPDFVAGHSLGQYSALVAASSVAADDAVRLVRARGRYMQEAVPEGVGAMAAIIGVDDDGVAALCAELSTVDGVVEPANYNAPGQVVVAGHRDAVERLMERARAEGARRAIPLNVSAPFHCSLMQPAAERLAGELEGVDLREPRLPVIDNVEARPLADAGAVRAGLIRQVTAPVRWSESLRWMADRGARHFVEVGPGRVLAGLVKRTLEGVEILAVETAEQVEEAVAALRRR